MLQLYDLSKVKIKGLRLYKDMNIESVLSSGDKTLSFLYPSRLSKDIKEECYIRTKKDEFVVKEISTNGEWNSIKATLNVEDLEGQAWEHFDTTEKTISQCLTLAVAGTGWTVQVNGVTKRRTIRKTNCSTWDIIQQAKKTYLVEVEFDTINKVVKVAEKLGADKGVYFMDSLNLRNLDVQSNSYDFYTRLIAIGKDDLKVTVENYQYSSKKKTFIWKDERYTDLASLREDATKKLDEISKPYRSYGADIIDLANINNKYSILAYGLGDTITLISKDKEIKEKQRIVKITEYPEEPHRNNCEIANSMLSFADIQKEYNDTVDTVTNITEDNGTISEGAIRTAVEHLTVNKLDVGSLNAVEIRVGNLEATKANITDLTAINASITILQANKANITDLTAAVGRVNILESNVADIKTLVNGNLTSSNIQSLVLSSDKVTVQNGFIKNAMIENVDIGKVNAGDISTNKFRIKSDNGGIEIVGATQQFKDKNGNIRIQMGQDAKGDFNFILRGTDGTTTLIDHTGIKEKAIADNLIKENMISENAIKEKQIDYSSFTTGFNKETNTNTLKSSKVLLDGTNQTLNVAFNSLSTTVNNVKEITTSNTTAINVQQGKIDILISNTTIVKDGVTTQLKDAYNSTVATVDSINSVISSHSSSINNLTGQITDVNTRTNDIKRTLDGTVSTVSSHTTQISGLNSTVNTQGSSISQLLNQIALKVEQTQVNTIVNGAIDGIKLGGRNLILNSKLNLTTREYLIKEFKTSINFIEGKKYTFVVKGETTSVQKFGLWMNNGSSNVGYLSKGQSGIEYITFTAVAPNNGMEKSIRIYNYPKDLVNNPPSTVEWVAMYEGEIKPPMDWTPAPEDTEEVITSISDKVATIETNLTGITSRVSGVEQTTSTIGGNVSSIDSRLKIAEQKITDSAIISTVSSTINTAKTDAINSANNSTDNKLKNYSTTTQMNTAITQNATSIKQEVSNSYLSKADATTTYATKASMELTANQLKLDFSSTVGYNYYLRSAPKQILTGTGAYLDLEYGDGYDGRCKSNRYQGVMVGGGEISFRQAKVIPKNGVYSVSFYAKKISGAGTPEISMDLCDNTAKTINTVTVTTSWKLFKFENISVNNYSDIYNFIDIKFYGTVASSYTFHISHICINEGAIALPWAPNASEIHDGSTQIDANGVTIFNGAIDIRNRAGTSVLKGDSNGNLMVRGNLYADPANPILHLFGGCSIDATANNEQGVGSAVRLKWNENSYIRIATDVTDIYQNGVARFRFYPNYLDCKPPTIYFADQCKIDASSGTFRFYISKSVDTGIRISPDGTVAFLVSGTPKHVFNTNGTKAGGTIVVDGATLGMSPIDSPQVLLESVLFDIDVKESGTTVLLDSTFLKTISKYAVFCSNPSVTIVSKDRTSFLVQGYTGKVDFRVIGYRIGYEEQYYQLVG